MLERSFYKASLESSTIISNDEDKEGTRPININIKESIDKEIVNILIIAKMPLRLKHYYIRYINKYTIKERTIKAFNKLIKQIVSL
jgi:hypothetical protein